MGRPGGSTFAGAGEEGPLHPIGRAQDLHALPAWRGCSSRPCFLMCQGVDLLSAISCPQPHSWKGQSPAPTSLHASPSRGHQTKARSEGLLRERGITEGGHAMLLAARPSLRLLEVTEGHPGPWINTCWRKMKLACF